MITVMNDSPNLRRNIIVTERRSKNIFGMGEDTVLSDAKSDKQKDSVTKSTSSSFLIVLIYCFLLLLSNVHIHCTRKKATNDEFNL
jgi:hypothetical protein